MAKKQKQAEQTKQSGEAKQVSSLQLQLLNPCCAAIDVGATMMMISYSDSAGKQHLLEANAFTEDLQQVAQTLKGAGVKKVAMEATGVYWIVIYELLESSGFELTLVNARHFKNVDGQKTDVKDSQWLHQLHAHGLLRNSHIAAEVFRELKSYIHEREILQRQKSDTLNRIQKTLTQMNIKVQHLISDIEGVNGMKLIRAIAGGIKEPSELLALINVRKLKATEADLIKSLQGIYKEQYVTILAGQLRCYDFYKEQMVAYEASVEGVLQKLLPEDKAGEKVVIDPKKKSVRKNEYSINLTAYLKRITGVDLTAIPGLDEKSLLDILAVTGLDMGKWKTAAQFTSWLGLSPDPKKSGGKVIGHKRKFTKNKATRAFRLGAQSMWQDKSVLGQQYRRLAARKGSPKANKAIARKLAVIFYTLMSKKEAYDAKKMEIDTEKQQAKRIEILRKEAKKYGLTLSEAA